MTIRTIAKPKKIEGRRVERESYRSQVADFTESLLATSGPPERDNTPKPPLMTSSTRGFLRKLLTFQLRSTEIEVEIPPFVTVRSNAQTPKAATCFLVTRSFVGRAYDCRTLG